MLCNKTKLKRKFQKPKRALKSTTKGINNCLNLFRINCNVLLFIVILKSSYV